MYLLTDKNQYQLEVDNLLLKTPHKIGHNGLKIPILLTTKKNRKTPIFIQTPRLYLPFGINLESSIYSYYLDLSLKDKEYDSSIVLFINLIKKCIDKIKILLLENKYVKKTSKFLSPIKKDVFGERITTKLNNISGNISITVYDQYKNRCELNEIQKQIYSKAIIQVSDIYINLDNKKKIIQYKLNLVLHQIKIYKPINLTKYAFIDDDRDKLYLIENKDKISNHINETNLTNNNTTINNIDTKNTINESDKLKNHPELKTYFQMLKVGVPKPNIIQKMSMSNINPMIIDLNPEKPLSPDINIYKDINLKSGGDIINGIQQGIQLNKSTHLINNIPKIYKNKLQNNIPTLDDIIKGIKSLRKTNIQNKYISSNLYQKDKYIKDKLIVKKEESSNSMGQLLSMIRNSKK